MELIGKGKTGKSKDKLYRYQFEKKKSYPVFNSLQREGGI